MEKSKSTAEISKALAGFQKEVGNVAKDAVNPFFKSKYASLENVISTVKPVLEKHGLSYTQFPDLVYNRTTETYAPALTTALLHVSGEWIEATTPIIIKDQTPQGQGSAITYMRRYALSAILGIATEDDDDGNAASAPKLVGKPAAKSVAKPNPTKPWQASPLLKKEAIAKALQAEGETPLVTKEDFERMCFEATGLELVEKNFDEIIKTLNTKWYGN